MSVDREYRIRISTVADTGGVETTTRALHEGRKALAEEGKQSEESAKQTEFLSLKKHDLKRVVGELSREFPIAGQAARLMMNTMVASITMAIGVFARLKTGIETLTANLTTSVWEDYGKVIEAKKGAFEAAAEGAEKFRRELTQIATATNTASESSERLMTVFKAQQSAEQSVDEAHKRLELAQAGGIQDPVARQAKILEIEERYAARERQRQEDGAQFEIKQQREKLGNEERAASALGKQREGAEARLKGMASEAEITTRLNVERGRTKTIEAEYFQKTERLQELKDKTWGLRTTPEQIEMNILDTTTVSSLQSQLYAQRKLVADLEKTSAPKVEAYRKESENVDRLREMEKGALQRAMGIRSMLPTQEAVVGIESDARRTVGQFETKTRSEKAAAEMYDRDAKSPQTKMFREAAAAESVLEHGGRLSDKGAQALAQARSVLSAHGMNADAILHTLASVVDNSNVLFDRIRALERQVAVQGKQFRSQAAGN